MGNTIEQSTTSRVFLVTIILPLGGPHRVALGLAVSPRKSGNLDPRDYAPDIKPFQDFLRPGSRASTN
jgi:hypothetical protein